jgi:hypothetical protein
MSNSIEQAATANNEPIDLPTLADAQDGSEVLFAVARLLEDKYGREYGYAKLVRNNAHAIRNLTDELQPWVVANEPDEALTDMWRQLSPRDSDLRAGSHNIELRRRLDIP